jgi:hypothetical protein
MLGSSHLFERTVGFSYLKSKNKPVWFLLFFSNFDIFANFHIIIKNNNIYFLGRLVLKFELKIF